MTHGEISNSQQKWRQDEEVEGTKDANLKQTDEGWKQVNMTFCADGDAMLVGHQYRYKRAYLMALTNGWLYALAGQD